MVTAPRREFLSVDEAADFIGVSATTMNRWRAERGGPAFCKLGGRITYRVDDLREFALATRTEAMR